MKMRTPIKNKASRRVMTTAYTEQRMLTANLDESKYSHKNALFIDEYCADVNRKLAFQGLAQSRLYQVEPKNTGKDAKTIQQKYRQSMLSYLNSKFQQLYSPQQATKQTQPKRTDRANSTPKHQQTQIKVLFNSYMDAIRQQRIREMTEYYLGVVLKKTHFINSILYERETISLLWKQLAQPNIGQLFVFICVLYFHIDKMNIENETQLLAYIESMFAEQGFRFSGPSLQDALGRTKAIFQKRHIKFQFLNNRQNRHTASSLNRIKQR